jgi:hypothetical protein
MPRWAEGMQCSGVGRSRGGQGSAGDRYVTTIAKGSVTTKIDRVPWVFVK